MFTVCFTNKRQIQTETRIGAYLNYTVPQVISRFHRNPLVVTCNILAHQTQLTYLALLDPSNLVACPPGAFQVDVPPGSNRRGQPSLWLGCLLLKKTFQVTAMDDRTR